MKLIPTTHSKFVRRFGALTLAVALSLCTSAARAQEQRQKESDAPPVFQELPADAAAAAASTAFVAADRVGRENLRPFVALRVLRG